MAYCSIQCFCPTPTLTDIGPQLPCGGPGEQGYLVCLQEVCIFKSGWILHSMLTRVKDKLPKGKLGGDIGAGQGQETGQTTTVEGGLHIHVTPAEEWTTFMRRLILTDL